MSEPTVPVEGRSYQDRDGRVLLVKDVREVDPLGREVIGLVYQPTSGPMGMKGLEPGRDFATSLLIFGVTWQERDGQRSVADAIAPPVDDPPPPRDMPPGWCGTPGLMEMQRRREQEQAGGLDVST